VVNNPRGTAYQAFQSAPELARKIYAKTGTAQIGGLPGSLDSVWFVGWVDGLGTGARADRRIAFACIVTHASRDGGKVCAPLMRVILTRLEAAWHEPS
jgi:cell division protein FtsI/penicillin-binding protein 2